MGFSRFLAASLAGVVGAVLLALGVVVPSVRAATLPAVADTYSGTLAITGRCPFDYRPIWINNSAGWAPGSYPGITVTGTLNGFTAGETYYVSFYSLGLINAGHTEMTANAAGQIIFRSTVMTGGYVYFGSGTNPDQAGVEVYVSAGPPPAPPLYNNSWTLVSNKACTPWIAPVSTNLTDPHTAMVNGNYAFTSGEYASDGPVPSDGRFCVRGRWPYPSTTYWCTPTKGATNARMWFQRDGNLVVYSGTRAIWQSKTSGHPRARLAVQRDHNLVIYSQAGKVLWQAHSYG